MNMVAKPLCFNWGQKKGFVLFPNWKCDDQLPISSLRSVTNMIDRGGGPSCGDGPVFIAHHYVDGVPDSPYEDGYRLYSRYFTGGYAVYAKDSVISAFNQSFVETQPVRDLAFEFVGWYVNNGTLYEFNLEGTPQGLGGKYTGHYSYDQLYAVNIVRYKGFGITKSLSRDSRALEYADQFGGSWGMPKSNEIWRDVLQHGSLEAIYSHLCAICRNENSYEWEFSYRSSIMGVLEFGKPRSDPHDLNSFVFPKGQYYYWSARVADLPGNVSNGLCTAYFADAYYKAIDKLPKLKQNLLANILELVAALKSFKNGYKAIYSAKEIASSAWLSYRYAYKTTVHDLEEATGYIGRLYYLLETEARVVRSYGTHIDGGAVYNCTVECDFAALMSASLAEKLDKQYNFRLSLTNVWDMIPFSFVVDWFLGIGDILEEIDQWLDSASIPVTRIWYSYNESYFTPTGQESVYLRWAGKAPSLPYFTELYSSKSASSVTLLKRGLDSLALLF